MNSAPCLICVAPTNLCTPTAYHMPTTEHRSAAFEVSQPSVLLHVNCNMCGEPSQSGLGFIFSFTALCTTASFFLSFPSPPLFPTPPVSFSQMRNVVITEQMNLLTPQLDLWDADISDVRQCFTHVHVCSKFR